MKQSSKGIKILIVAVLLFAVASIVYSQLAPRFQRDADFDLNTQAPPAADFTVIDYDFDGVSLSSLIGKPVIVNFWASWCPPCIAELPYFQSVYEEYKDEVHFMMINLVDGSRETVDIAKRFVENNGYTFPVYFDTTGEASGKYKVFSIPSTIFVDSEGALVRVLDNYGNKSDAYVGQMAESTLRSFVEQLVKDAKQKASFNGGL